MLDAAIASQKRLVTSAEVLQEILHRYVAIKRLDAIQPAFDALVGVVDGVVAIEEDDVLLREGISRVMSFDADVDRVTEDLYHRNPELRTLAAISAHAMDLRSTTFQRGAFLFDDAGDCAVTHAYVCLDDEGLAISTALLLMNHLRQYGVHVMVRTNRVAGLAALLRAVGAQGSRGVSHLHVFSLLEQACQPEFVLHGTNEVLARALHQEYLAQASGSQNPSAVPWDNLALDLKESNRRQADHIATKLEAVHCHSVPLTALEGAAFTFAPTEVEQLAEMEHERWVAERRAQGWTRGPRDPAMKTNPSLVSWADLDESAREINRSSVRRLPFFLNRAGFTAHRFKA